MSDTSGRYVIDKNGKIIERKKKSRLYSLGGNEPKKSHLVRMKTVGTFDLCMEMTTSLACGFNQDILPAQKPPPNDEVSKPSAVLEKLESEDEKVSQADSNSISPKRQRHISSSENSLTVDESSINSNTKKRFRSLSSNLCLVKRDSNEFLCKSADLLDSSIKTYDKDFNDILTGAVSASNILNKSENNIYESFKSDAKVNIKKDHFDDMNASQSSAYNLPLRARRRTFKKSKKIVRTDSELFKEQILSHTTDASPIRKSLSAQTSKQTSTESSDKPDTSSKNISIDTVFSDMCEEEQIDLEKLEIEYKDHVKSNLQREYKSDGDALDEAGKDSSHYAPEWRNQSVDFEFLETDKVEELRLKSCSVKSHSKKIRNDSESRSKSEGDKDTLYLKADSTETQSTEDENKTDQSGSDSNKGEKHQSLFEKRFGKLKKMNKLLKVKRFSTSALYDKRKTNDTPVTKPKETQPPALAALSQITDFTSSKTSLASPKSLKGKRFMLKKRKFSFFGKSQSNTDLNISLKSIASKLSLLSKSNFDLSKHSSNLRLNAVGIYGRYGNSTDYRSDIITKQHGCTSPLSEAFYNATGSYQLTPMELFEKFCSQDFTGLYKHEPLDEDPDMQVLEAGNHNYKGAIKKSSSLRKTTLLKQNSEPKFNIKSYQLDQYFGSPHEVFEEEEIDETVEDEEDEYLYNLNTVQQRRSSYGRQLEFDQNDQYYESNEDKFYENDEVYVNVEEDIDEIFLMPGKQRYDGRYSRNSDEILAIDETDEEILEDSEDLLEEIDSNLLPVFESDQCESETLVFTGHEEFSEMDDNDSNLKTIISEYVKNACASATSESIARSKSMDLLSNSSDTMKTNSNSEYAFDTVKQIHFDSCSTSKLSLSLNSDIFDDITLAAPLESLKKPIKICEMENFTLTPDGSFSENNNGLIMTKENEQEIIKNELQSQYTIIDCDELEHDEDGELQRFNDEKSSFAEALNKEFDKLFTRAINDSDTDITTTPSGATVLTAIKLPSRGSMEKLEALPFEFNQDNCVTEKVKPSAAPMSQSMTTNTLHQSISSKKEESAKSKSKRSHSLGAITKKKSNKCTPL